METAKDIVLQYKDDILSGRIPSGRYIRLAMERFERDLNSDEYYVDWKESENIYTLGKCLHHYVGDFAGQPFILSPWQLWICTNIFGVKRRSDNGKKYSVSKVCCAKKQGKTMFTVLQLLYAALSEPNSPECYFTANSRQQARIAYLMLEQLVKQLDPKHKEIKVLRNEMRIKPNNGMIKVLSSDSSKADGLNCSFAIVDEFEEAESNAMFENLLSATAARSGQAHISVTGTAGFSRESADYQMNMNCMKILEGEIIDETIFIAIYMMDEDDDYYDEFNWIKCNPNLNVSVSRDFLDKRAQTARQTPSQEVPILTKNFNVYMDSPSTWIPYQVLRDQKFHFDWDEFVANKKKYICFAGFDLSSVSDFTALSLMFFEEATGNFYFYTKYYLPESALTDSPNKTKYKEWARLGYLDISKGSNVCDYDYVLNDLQKMSRDFGYIYCGYDPYNSTYLVIKATEAGLPLEPFGQNLLNFNQPTKELERLVREGKAFIDDNPINYFCFANVVLKEDFNENVKPIKKTLTSNFKIDGVISMLTCLGEFFKYNTWW